MAGETIKITRWMIFRRRMLDRLNSLVARFRTWLKQATNSRRALKSSEPLSIADPRLKGTGHTPHNNDTVIQIKRTTRTEPLNPPETTQLTERFQTRTPETNRRPTGTGRRRVISVEIIKQTCLACTDKILADEPLAKCQRNKEHVIHMRCVSLVKNKCPTCKGKI
jgi:hypothetical protein